MLLITLLTSLVFGAYSEEDIPAVCPNIITRSQWEGRLPNTIQYSIFPLDYVIIHATVTPSCDSMVSCSALVRSIQNYFMNELDIDDMGYNFLVGGDGNVYEGCGWHKVGAHTFGYNSRSIGIGLIGTFTKYKPPEKQLQATKNLLDCGVLLGELSANYTLYGGRQVIATDSPGIKVFSQIKTWPHFRTPPKIE